MEICVCANKCVAVYGCSGEYLTLGVKRWRHLIQHGGLTHLTLQQCNLAIPAQPSGCVCKRERETVCVCVCVCVWGMGVMKREHSEQEYCVMFSGPNGPMGGNPAVYLDRFLPWITRTFTSAAYPHHNLISHTIRTPLAEDTHAHTSMHAHMYVCY